MHMNNMDFGWWQNHLALSEMLSWGYLLPVELEAEISEYSPQPEDAMPLDNNHFVYLWDNAVEYAQHSVSTGGVTLPAHNYELHFQLVVDHGLHLFDAHFGNQAWTYGAVRQALALGLLLHDCHHCGSTLRQDHTVPLHLPELGIHISVEEVSAIAANRFLRAHGVPLPWRVFIVGLIWASTFGHGPALERSQYERGIYVPPLVQPNTFYHALMRVADCQPTASFEELLKYGSRVHVGEMPATGRRATDPAEFIAIELGFLAYVGHSQDELDRIAGHPLTTITGMRAVQEMLYQKLSNVASGLDPDSFSFISTMLQYYPHYS